MLSDLNCHGADIRAPSNVTTSNRLRWWFSFFQGGNRLSALAVNAYTISKLPQVCWGLHSKPLLCVKLMPVEPRGHGTGLTIGGCVTYICKAPLADRTASPSRLIYNWAASRGSEIKGGASFFISASASVTESRTEALLRLSHLTLTCDLCDSVVALLIKLQTQGFGKN